MIPGDDNYKLIGSFIFVFIFLTERITLFRRETWKECVGAKGTVYSLMYKPSHEPQRLRCDPAITTQRRGGELQGEQVFRRNNYESEMHEQIAK